MPKTIAIIQAREDSTRLPGKALTMIDGKPVIQWIVNRLKAVNLLEPLIDEIIVAMPKNKKNDLLALWCEVNQVKFFRGHNTDVLSRFVACAKIHKPDWILRICGDCPFIEPLMVYGLLKEHRVYYQALAFNRHAIPGGWDAELFSYQKLLEADKKTKGKEREHVSKNMRKLAEEDLLDFGTDFNFSKVKLDLDTPEDLRRLKEYGKLL